MKQENESVDHLIMLSALFAGWDVFLKICSILLQMVPILCANLNDELLRTIPSIQV